MKISIKNCLSFALFLCVVIVTLLIKLYDIDLVKIIPAHCILYENYGFYCTGCGGTRACMALIHGNYIESIRYYPAIIYLVVLFIYYFIMNIISLAKKMHKKIVKPIHFYILIAIILIQWIVKNFLLIMLNYRII